MKAGAVLLLQEVLDFVEPFPPLVDRWLAPDDLVADPNDGALLFLIPDETEFLTFQFG
jgi:hypothetical protein